MNLNNLHLGRTFELWFDPLFPESVSPEHLKDAIGCLKANGSENYTFMIRQKDGMSYLPVPVKSRGSVYDLNFHVSGGNAQLAQVANMLLENGENGLPISFQLKIIFFAGTVVELGDVDIGIDEKIVDTAKKNRTRFNAGSSECEALCSLLREKCAITAGDETYFLVLCGAAADDEFEKEFGKDIRAFALYGERVTIPVERREMPGGDESFFASKIVFKDARKGDVAFRLARGTLRFFDWTKSGEKISALARGALRRINESGSPSDSYLARWDRYTQAEGNDILRNARDVGVLRYNAEKYEKTGSTVKLFLSDPLPEKTGENGKKTVALDTSMTLMFVDEAPLYLTDPGLNFAEYREKLKEFEEQRKPQEKFYGKIAGFSKGEKSVTLRMDFDPPKNKLLVLSIFGDEVQIKRRETARKAVMEGRSANPLLGMLIEQDCELPPEPPRITHHKALSPFVRDKIFSTEPRCKQIEAIEIALNTPDFALIQGPPGTGKTTVITAILERLNEIYDKGGLTQGRILISSSQHDAVENLATRLTINSLPAMKFGRQSESYEQNFDSWRNDLAQKIRAAHPELTETENQNRLHELFAMYVASPSSRTATEIIRFILEMKQELLTDEIIRDAKIIKTRLVEENENEDSSIIGFVRALRITETAFFDDGPERALALLNELEDAPDTYGKLDQDKKNILFTAARWTTEKGPPDFIKELKDLKRDLLLRYTPKPYYRIEKPRSDIKELIALVNRQLEKSRDYADAKKTALAAFMRELEDNPGGVTEILENYSVVYAATVQGAGGDDMSKIKRAAVNISSDAFFAVTYDTVIIDEAARVSPPDLLIPLSQAEKRVILVGDHRQLPQLIEDDIINAAIAEEKAEIAKKMESEYKQSMFGYLFSRLKKLEEKDDRPRTVTLDAQFRMHPLLGKFISDHFYKPFDEGFVSPLPASLFIHNLPRATGKAAAWLDVPFVRGSSQRYGTSWGRRSEADAIAALLAEWIDYPCLDTKPLSFGIISFYKAQSDALYESLSAKGFCHKNEDEDDDKNAWTIDEKYAGRLRVGTVDSFQGMEFDVVFLSLVRAGSVPKGEINDKLKTRTFGHLLSVNRLCVSMSRQKKLLVVAGDAELMRSELARDSVPALFDFRALCETGVEGVML